LFSHVTDIEQGLSSIYVDTAGPVHLFATRLQGKRFSLS